MQGFLHLVRDFALMLTRIVVGVTLLARGWYRWQIVGIPGEVGIIENSGLPYATTLVWLVIGFEIIGGILLIFGLATPLIGLMMVVLNVGIIVLRRGGQGFFVHEGGWEYNALLAIIGLVLLTHGSGRAGLDSLFMRPKDDRGSDLISRASETEHS